MFTIARKTALAFAAVMALGSIALVTTDASARGFGGGHGGGFSKVGGGGTKFGGGFKHPGFKHPGFKHPGFKHPDWKFGKHHPHPWKWHYGFRRHYWVAPVVATGIATRYVSQPTWNRCNCLTKEYTPEGAVVFKDLCTKEMAMNPPATAPAPAAYDPTQMPAVQGSTTLPQQTGLQMAPGPQMAMPMQPAPLPALQTR
jgi:hypothetical protein